MMINLSNLFLYTYWQMQIGTLQWKYYPNSIGNYKE